MKLRYLGFISLVLLGGVFFLSACNPKNNPTSSPSSSSTATFTPTITVTPGGPTYTPTSSPTPGGNYLLTGAINYSPGPNNMVASLFDINNYGGSVVCSHGGNFSVNGGVSVYLLEAYDAAGTGSLAAGDPICFFTPSGATGCNTALFTVYGDTTMGGSFDASHVLYGASGTVTYTGSLGTVSADHVIKIEAFASKPSTICGSVTALGESLVSYNGSVYAGINMKSMCAPSTVYLMVWYEYGGFTPVPDKCPISGFPYTIVGPFTTSANKNAGQNITLSDTYLWN